MMRFVDELRFQGENREGLERGVDMSVETARTSACATTEPRPKEAGLTKSKPAQTEP